MRRPRGWLAAFALIGAGSSAACSLLFDTDDQCTSDSDCTGRGAAFAGTTCVQSVCVTSSIPNDASNDTNNSPVDASDASDASAFACQSLPPPDPDSTHPVGATLSTIDFSAGGPADLLDVRLCAVTDPSCVNPRTSLATTPGVDAGRGSGLDASLEGGWIVPGADGIVQATVERGFEGFFDIRSSQYFPTTRFTSPPLRNDENLLDEIMLRPGEISLFVSILKGDAAAYDQVNRALVFTLVRDCNGNPIPNVSFSTDAFDVDVFPFYVINTLPSTSATKTDATGRGGFANVKPGLAKFTAKFADTMQYIGSTQVLVTAGHNVTLTILPSP